MARVVIPGVAHHVAHRGNCRCDVFTTNADRQMYLSLLAKYSQQYGLEIQAYCLMSNHVHFVVVPQNAYSLGQTFHDTHQTYALRFNRRAQETGHLWQGRYYSVALDTSHFWSAVRYVERNPVRAGIVEHAWEYHWSSAAAHCGQRTDALLHGNLEQADHVGNWQNFLLDEDDAAVRQLRRNTCTGRPLGPAEFVAKLEALLGRSLQLRKPGPKPKPVN